MTCLFKEEVVSQIDPKSIPNRSNNPPKSIQNSDQNRSKIGLGVVSGPISSEMETMKQKKRPTPKVTNPFWGPENGPKFYLMLNNYLKIAPEGLRRRFEERLKTCLNIEGSWDRFPIDVGTILGASLGGPEATMYCK